MNGHLIKINSTDITPYLKGWSPARPKLSTDSGRNLAGDLRFTHLGIYPKFNLTFRPMDDDEIAVIVTLLDNPSFTVEWWDLASKSYKTGVFYPGDFETPLLIKDKGIYDSFKVSIVAVNKK